MPRESGLRLEVGKIDLGFSCNTFYHVIVMDATDLSVDINLLRNRLHVPHALVIILEIKLLDCIFNMH